ncbi:hypothetical protein PISMIDRAFT_671788 [Pisolithus microcarpus 441]|uniref:Unplaced genomic scaffold scaffold_4, whole genome shotgun sequence n=1 Tax=Pisolithus microcarpus 441 TaxID=765257 RepID=A0A0C9ZKF0_9AGAM|nr:hypothetical protein PISMIDRAFT_671788 [Pisolithus microcarpus 441]
MPLQNMARDAMRREPNQRLQVERCALSVTEGISGLVLVYVNLRPLKGRVMITLAYDRIWWCSHENFTGICGTSIHLEGSESGRALQR